MTSRSLARRGLAALVAAVALVLLVEARPRPAGARSTCGAPDCSASDGVHAAKKSKDEGLLDKVGLGSLEDLAWGALPAALALSALIGAAGGFVYAGIVGGRSSKAGSKRKEGDEASS